MANMVSEHAVNSSEISMPPKHLSYYLFYLFNYYKVAIFV